MFAQRFDSGDVMTLRLRREQRTRVDWFAVEQNCVCAREALLIAEFDSVKAKSAQRVE